MIGANKGIGFQVMNAQYNFQIPLMFAASSSSRHSA